MKRFGRMVTVILVAFLINDNPVSAEVLLTPEEIDQALAHGPWPPGKSYQPAP